MPAVAKTSDLDIINAARTIIAESGVDSLAMQAVAAAVGIKAPSLYKRFAGREAIVRSVALAEFAELEKKIDNLIVGLTPADAIRAIARTQWTLAEERPRIYEILFRVDGIKEPDHIAIRTDAMMPLFNSCRSLIGPGLSLAAARTLSAYIHGFLSLKMSGTFDKAPGLEGSFYYGLNAIIRGISGK